MISVVPMVILLALGQAKGETLRQKYMREMKDPAMERAYEEVREKKWMKDEDDPRPPELPDDLKFERTWQTGKKCGPVSLFFLLRLKGFNIPRDRVISAVPLGEQGASLADLQKAAERFGLRTRTVKFDPENMPALPTPYIVHYNLSGSDDSKENHFDVVFKHFDKSRCNFVDTTNCVIRSGDFEAMVGRVSGYALITESRSGWWMPFLWTAFAAILAANIIMLLRILLRRLSAGHNRIPAGVEA